MDPKDPHCFLEDKRMNVKLVNDHKYALADTLRSAHAFLINGNNVAPKYFSFLL